MVLLYIIYFVFPFYYCMGDFPIKKYAKISGDADNIRTGRMPIPQGWISFQELSINFRFWILD